MRAIVEVIVLVAGVGGLMITAYYAYMRQQRIRQLIHLSGGPLDGKSVMVSEDNEVYADRRSIYRKTSQTFGKGENPIFVYEGRLQDDGTIQ